ncbi:sensor domain-containing protein [Cellulomonas telluris]|uniref:sensor domain-containing protein n=1 Tax=Cellulomonas telluris TaxID=2306636 RepID=UPI0010A8F564|nr:sensor domain-containing protein [Cellulomonas telluris]
MPGRDEQRGRPWWPWVLGVLALVVVLAVVRPWGDGTSPSPSPSVTSTGPVPTPTPTSVAPTTPAASPLAPPGADAVFDAATIGTLLLTRGDVEDAVPAAEAGVTQGLAPGVTPWGLPTGGAVDPAECTAAVTVVAAPPVAHDALAWGNEEVQVAQDVVVLPDPAAARAAFAALVTTADQCPTFTVHDAAGGEVRWVTQPAIEGQGVLPAIVQEVRVQDGDSEPRARYVGHTLVGNAIVTWSATARDPGARERASEVLGATDQLAGAVEERALAAVRSLS